MDDKQMQFVTLDGLGDGAALEKFQTELGRVLENIADINTPATDKRKITLTFEFKPDEDRQASKIIISSSSTLASDRRQEAIVAIGRHGGRRVAVDRTPPQLPFQEPENQLQAVADQEE